MVHHTPPAGVIDHLNLSITQDASGLMWMANRQGVVQYDGQNWLLIPTSSAIFKVLSVPGKIYASGRNVIGKVVSENHQFSFLPILSADSLDDVFNGVALDRYVLFLSEHTLTVIDVDSDAIVKRLQRDDLEFNDLFIYGDQVILTTENQGSFLVHPKDWQLHGQDEFDQLGDLISISGNSKGEYLAINSEGYIFSLNESKDTLKFEEIEYLLNSNPTSLEWVDDELVAISTLSGGVVFVNTSTLDYEITNYFSGLPENQIYTMAIDKEKGVWVSHAFGFTRILPLFPIRSFSHIPGIEGNILSIRNYKGHIYAGSTVGVYVLKKVPIYSQRVIYETVYVDNDAKEVKRKKGFRGLFNKNNKIQEPSQVSTIVKRIERELQSVKYRFNKISGINEETNQFYPISTGLLASGLSGIYEIQDTTAIPITTQPIRYLHYSDKNRMIAGATYSNEVLTYSKRRTWVQTDELKGLEDYIYHIAESEENMWFAGADSIYRVEFEQGALQFVDVFQLNNPHFDETFSAAHNGKMTFINRSGFSVYDKAGDRIVKDSTLLKKFGVPQKVFISNDNSTWVYNGKDWNILGTNLPEGYFNFLNAFPNIRQLEFSSYDSTYWVVTFDNNIYNVKPAQGLRISPHKIQLKEASNNKNALNTQQTFEIQQDDNNLNFRFIQPDYSGVLSVEYQYRLSGLTDEWSPWSRTNNQIAYSYLPPGKYVLEVVTRDNFGNHDSYAPIAFNVVPPYWRQPWFYALEVLLFSLLLVLSIRLNRGAGNYGVLSRLLAFLTLILIVEFVQTVAENKFETDNSPVIDFFIQVSIALLVLPVESLLRKAIFKKQIEPTDTPPS